MGDDTLPRIRKFIWDDNGQPITKDMGYFKP